MLKPLFKFTGLFESNLSAAEWAWRILTLLTVAAGGTTAGLLAQASEWFQKLGPIAWFGIALLSALLIAVIFYLVKLGRLRAVEARFLEVVAQPRATINPLSEAFSDQVISLSDLYLPRYQPHSNKHFKRCKIVGPGAIALVGGTIIKNDFFQVGSVIVIPQNSHLTGVLVLDNCTIEQCEFIGTTILVNEHGGRAFLAMGAKVVGLPSAA